MNIVVETLTQTPWWVYLLFFVLVRRGLAAARPSVVPVWKLSIMPLIFLVLDITGMTGHSRMPASVILVTLLSLACGALAASFLVRHVAVKADRAAWRIGLPGDPMVLPTALAAFAVKYAVGYLQATSLALASTGGFLVISLAVSSFFTGIFFGRFFTYLFKFFSAPTEALSAKGA